jgi:hypothetical protein
MSRHQTKTPNPNTDKDPWYATLFSVLVSYLLVQPTILLMLLLGRPFRGWLSQKLALPAHSGKWHSWSWLFNVIRCVSGIVFFITAIRVGHVAYIADAREQFLFLLQQGLTCLACAGVFDVLTWLEAYAEDPDTQKHLAGQKAEQLVKELVEGYRTQDPEARSLHGALFVFHPGSADEFSVEIDHLLVTRRNVFVIETKYKSGTITATAEAADWKVETSAGSTSMRNALKQAKTTARVLQRQFSLSCEIVPVVAIAGNEVQVVGGPTNVVIAYDLPRTLHAFEFMQELRIANPAHVLMQLQKYISTDPDAMQRHIARAQAARIRGEMAEIVQAASLQ